MDMQPTPTLRTTLDFILARGRRVLRTIERGLTVTTNVTNAVADLLDKVGDDMPPPERAELCRIADQLRQQVRPQQS